jgi:predicted nucleotidyltransferase
MNAAGFYKFAHIEQSCYNHYMSEQLEEIKKLTGPVFKRYNIKRAGVFGSVARGEATANSDVDILVDMDSNYDFFDFLQFKQELETSLNKKVDVLEYRAIKPLIRQNILNSEILIYEPER